MNLSNEDKANMLVALKYLTLARLNRDFAFEHYDDFKDQTDEECAIFALTDSEGFKLIPFDEDLFKSVFEEDSSLIDLWDSKTSNELVIFSRWQNSEGDLRALGDLVERPGYEHFRNDKTLAGNSKMCLFKEAAKFVPDFGTLSKEVIESGIKSNSLRTYQLENDKEPYVFIKDIEAFYLFQWISSMSNPQDKSNKGKSKIQAKGFGKDSNKPKKKNNSYLLSKLDFNQEEFCPMFSINKVLPDFYYLDTEVVLRALKNNQLSTYKFKGESATFYKIEEAKEFMEANRKLIDKNKRMYGLIQ